MSPAPTYDMQGVKAPSSRTDSEARQAAAVVEETAPLLRDCREIILAVAHENFRFVFGLVR